MGVVIDISPRLTRLRRARQTAEDVQRVSLRMASRYVRVTEEEIRRQILLLCDRRASGLQVEEACNALPLLTDLLHQRRTHLRHLEEELFGHDV